MIDLNPSEITEQEAPLSSGKSYSTFCWIGFQSANQTWHCVPEPALHSQPGRGWEPGGHCSKIPCSQPCRLGRQDLCLGCRVLHPG